MQRSRPCLQPFLTLIPRTETIKPKEIYEYYINPGATRQIQTTQAAVCFRNCAGRGLLKGTSIVREFTMTQRMAICFAAGVVGALAVVLFSHVLFQLGLSARLAVKAPASLKSPDIYRPLFWGGLWGIPFGLLVATAWNHLYLVGFLYVLAALLALLLFFLPRGGAGLLGLQQGGP